jgi:adhesin transport system outer membrane protein
MFEYMCVARQACSVTKGARVFALAATMTLGLSPAMSQDLKSTVADVLKTHPRLEASRHDVSSAEAKVKDTFRRAWTPNFDVSAESGRQKYESLANDGTMDYTRSGIKATQQVFDFGKSNRQVSENESVLNQSKALASAAEAGLLLEALSAHWSYVRAERLLAIARKSEESVRGQAKLESSMVELGKGYESNVLQAKVQLTSAESRRLRAEGALDIANARVKAIFGAAIAKVDYKNLAVIKAEVVPKSLEAAKALAIQNNQQIQVGMHRSQAISERISATRAKEFLPRFNLVAEKNTRHNTDGMSNERTFGDDKFYLQFLYNFNAGGAGLSAVESVTRDHAASVARELETRQLVEEQVSIAWRNVQVAGDNRQTLANLVRISAKFYEMAVAEREMGRRSLLEVLSAELSLINSLGDLMSTEADAAIAALTLAQAMGGLTLNSFEIKPIDAVLPKF